MQGAFGSTLEGLATLRGDTEAAEKWNEFTARQKKEGEEYLTAQPEGFGQDVVSAAGSSTPSLGLALGSAFTGARIGALGGPLGATVGAGVGLGTSFLPYFYGTHRESQKEEHGRVVSEGKAFAGAVGSTAAEIVADLTMLKVAGLLRVPVAKAAQTTLGKSVEKAVPNILKKMGVAAGVGFGAEATAELSQQIIDRAQAGKPLDNEEAIEEYKQAFLIGGTLGGVLAGAGAGPVSVYRNREAKAAEQAREDAAAEALDIDRQIDFAGERLQALPETVQLEETRKRLAEMGAEDEAKVKAEAEGRLALPDYSDSTRTPEDVARADEARRRRAEAPPPPPGARKYAAYKGTPDQKALLERGRQFLRQSVTYGPDVEGRSRDEYTVAELAKSLGITRHNADKLNQWLINDQSAIASSAAGNKYKSNLAYGRRGLESETAKTEKSVVRTSDKLGREAFAVVESQYSTDPKSGELIQTGQKALYTAPSREEAEGVLNSMEGRGTPETDRANLREALKKQEQEEVALQREAWLKIIAPVAKQLKTHMNKLGLDDVGLKFSNLIEYGGEGKGVYEGSTFDVAQQEQLKTVINLATGIYDPNISKTEYKNRLTDVLNHESIHAFKKLGLFKEGEYESLVKLAQTKKRPGKRYTYEQWARARNEGNVTTINEIQEEAVAEMFRYEHSSLAVPQKPRTIFRRIIEFMRNIGATFKGTPAGVRVMDSIMSGQIGARPRQARNVDATSRPMASLKKEIFTFHNYQTNEPFEKEIIFGTNPTRTQLLKLRNDSPYKTVRVINDIDNKRSYAWKAEDATHYDLAEQLGMAYDREDALAASGRDVASAYWELESDQDIEEYLDYWKGIRQGKLTPDPDDVIEEYPIERKQDDRTLVDPSFDEDGMLGYTALTDVLNEKYSAITTPEIREKLKDTKVVDENGVPVILYRGSRIYNEEDIESISRGEGRKYRTEAGTSEVAFFSTSPQLAATYGQPDIIHENHPGAARGVTTPVFINADTVKEFPVRENGQFNKFDFDNAASRLKSGEVLVARNAMDVGPRTRSDTDPNMRWSYPSDIYAVGIGTEVISAIGVPNPNIRYSAITETPAFKKWFGDSKVVDENGNPQVTYHISNAGFDVFDTERRPEEMGSHFAVNPDHVPHVSEIPIGSMKTILGKWQLKNRLAAGPQTYPVYLKITNPLRLNDYGTWGPNQVNAQLIQRDIITPKQANDITRGDYKGLRKVIQDAGYDGVIYLNRRESIDRDNRFSDEKQEKILQYKKELFPEYTSNELAGTFISDINVFNRMTDDQFIDVFPEAEGGDAYIAFAPNQIKSAIGNQGTFNINDPNIKYSFIGENSPVANKDARKLAKSWTERGVSRGDIWRYTWKQYGQGWYLNPVDGLWRVEISDDKARYDHEDFKTFKLRDALTHPELLEANKTLGDIPLEQASKLPLGKGSYTEPNRYKGEKINVGMGENFFYYNPRGDSDTILSTALHEIQHALQERYGFSRGSSPTIEGGLVLNSKKYWELVDDITREKLNSSNNSPWKKLLKIHKDSIKTKSKHLPSIERIMDEIIKEANSKIAKNMYMRQAGEVEARNVDFRKDFTPEMRRDRPPWQTQSYPYEEQLTRLPPDPAGLISLWADSHYGKEEGGSDGYQHIFGNDYKYSAISIPNTLAIVEKQILHNAVAPKATKLVGKFFKNPDKAENLVEGALILFQDRMLPIGKLVDKLKEQGGDVTNINNTYFREVMFSGQTDNRIQVAKKELYDPLLKAITELPFTDDDIAKMRKINRASQAILDNYKDPDWGTIELYLYALHAQERNALMRKRNAPAVIRSRGKKRKDQYEAGSGMSDIEAQQILDYLQKDRRINQLNRVKDKVRALINNTNDVRVKGNLTPDFRGTKYDVYENYVPLRSFVDEYITDVDPMDVTFARAGKGFKIMGKEDFSALGRSRLGAHIIEHTILQNEEAILRSGKNEVSESFLQLLEQNPELTKGVAVIHEFVPSRWGLDKRTGTVRLMTDPKFKGRDDVLVVKRGDREVNIEIKDDRIKRALIGRASVGTPGMEMVLSGLLSVNRFLANVRTSWSPEFMWGNLPRDFQQANVNLTEFQIEGLRAAVNKGVLPAINGIKKNLREGDTESEWAKWFLDGRKHGAITAFYGIRELGDSMKLVNENLRQDLSRSNVNQAKKTIKSIGKFVEDYNLAVENGIRISVYKALVEKLSEGSTDPVVIKRAKETAAFIAKNLTINFNMGGELKPLMNSLYLFFSAGTQGTFALLTPLARSKKIRRVWAGIFVAGIMQDVLMSTISPEDDDGRKQYDMLDNWIHETQMVFMDPIGISERGYMRIPLPYGLNAVFNSGRALAKAARGGADAGETFNSMFGTLFESFNPLSGSNSLGTFVSPTIADPMVELYQNKNFMDRPIYMAASPYGDDKIASQRYWDSTSGFYKGIASGLSKIGGGGEYIPGSILGIPTEFSPNAIQHMVEFIAGGAGAFARRTYDLGAELPDRLTGEMEEWDANDIILARRFFGHITSPNDLEYYMKNREKVTRVSKEIKSARDKGDGQRVVELMNKYPDEVKAIGLFNSIERSRRKLNKQKRLIQNNKNIPDDVRTEMVKTLKEKIDQLIGIANQRSGDLR
jgi:hypothetical protein